MARLVLPDEVSSLRLDGDDVPVVLDRGTLVSSLDKLCRLFEH